MADKIKDMAGSSKVMIFKHSGDHSADDIIGSYTTDYQVYQLSADDGEEIGEALKSFSGNKMPAVFIDGKYFGDAKQCSGAARDGSLLKKLQDAMCNISEKPSKQPHASDIDANAPKGPDMDYHTGKHKGASTKHSNNNP